MESGRYDVLSAVFGQGRLEISFLEDADQTADVIDIHQRLIDPLLFKDEIEDILDSLAEILDRSAEIKRKPIQSFTRPPGIPGME